MDNQSKATKALRPPGGGVHERVVIIYGRGRWKRGGDIKFKCKQLEGGQKFNAQVHGTPIFTIIVNWEQSLPLPPV